MDDLKKMISANYDFNVNEIEKIKNAYRISTDKGYKCFKASKYDINQFLFIISAISHLIEKGFENIICICPTRNNEKYVKLENGFGFMCDWIDSREANFSNPVELKMCVETLSKLHAASRGFEAPVKTGGRDQYGKWIKRFKKRCDELLYFKALIKEKDNLTEFDSIYLKYFDSHYRQGLKTIKDLENSEYLNVMKGHKILSEICHHDTANHNFLITPELKVYMIDFDYCILDSHIHDLSSLIIRNLKYGNWNSETMEYILDIYSKNIPINEKELNIIFCFMEFPQDFWQVGLQYYVEKQPWEEEIFIKRLNRTVNDCRERYEFLRDFEARLVEGNNV